MLHYHITNKNEIAQKLEEADKLIKQLRNTLTFMDIDVDVEEVEPSTEANGSNN